MNDIFSDDQLNVGKILVLEKNHKLTTSKIKKLTRATTIKKLKSSKTFDIDSLIISNVNNGLLALDDTSSYDYDVYYVTGNSSVSSALRLITDSVRGTIEWDAKKVKRLHNACFTKIKIDNAKVQLTNAKRYHEELVEALNNQKLSKTVASKTKSLSKITDGYADAVLKITVNNIRILMKSVW